MVFVPVIRLVGNAVLDMTIMNAATLFVNFGAV